MRYYETWAPIISGDYTFETRLIVTDESAQTPVPVTYTRISAPLINRTLNNDCLGIGGVNSATLDVSILTTDSIPKGAKVEVQARVVNDNSQGEWVPYGTFWVDTRETMPNGLVTLHCYDALLRTNYLFNYTVEEILQPKQMADVVEDVASRIGVQIDSRTSILEDDPNADFKIYAMIPPTDMQMSEALKYIGQINGGNWIMTEGNELRLVPLFDVSEAEEQSDDTVLVDAVIGQYHTGATQIVSRVAFEDDKGNVYGYGSNSEGFNIVCKNPYSVDQYASTLYQRYRDRNYFPYGASQVVLNPLFELGDKIEINGLVSQVVNARINMDLAFRVELSAPEGSQQSEYPYQSRFVQLLNDVKRVVEGQITDINNNLYGDDTVDGSVNERILAQINTTLDTISAQYVTQDGLKSYIAFTETGIRLGSVDSPIKIMLSNEAGNEGLYFYTGDESNATPEDAIAYFSNNQLYVNQVVAISSLRVGGNNGSYYWKVDTNGSLSLIYEGV